MAIYLPAAAEEEQIALDELTPREIVVELDKHVVGQKDAKPKSLLPRPRQRRPRTFGQKDARPKSLRPRHRRRRPQNAFHRRARRWWSWLPRSRRRP